MKVSSAFAGSFATMLRFEKFEIHKGCLRFSNLALRQNLSPNALAISSELSLELLFDVHVLLRFEIDRLNVHYIRKKSDCIVCREVSFERIYCDIPFCCSDRPIRQCGQPLSVPRLAHPRHGAARREVAAQPVQSGATCASDALSRHGRRSDGLLRRHCAIPNRSGKRLIPVLSRPFVS